MAPDPLMTELAGRLRREGLVVQERLGTGPRRVDLAVTVPGQTRRPLAGGRRRGRPGLRDVARYPRTGPAVAGRAGAARLAPPAGLEAPTLYRDPARDVARIVTAVREEARALDGPTPAEPGNPTTPASSTSARRLRCRRGGGRVADRHPAGGRDGRRRAADARRVISGGVPGAHRVISGGVPGAHRGAGP